MQITTINDGHDLQVRLLDYGARIAGLSFTSHELALSYPNIQAYATDSFYLGASIGPIANRIANGQISINGSAFQMPCNEASNSLHSGGLGFDKHRWEIIEQASDRVDYQLVYDLATIGLQGILSCIASYTVSNGTLKMEYKTQSDTTTYVNTTNHVYLNLSGQSASLREHEFELFGKSFLVTDESNIPTGEAVDLEPSPLRYKVGEEGRSGNQEYDELLDGCDHHFNTEGNLMMRAIALDTKVSLEVTSNAPGYQFYTGDYLSSPFAKNAGFCVETQLPPNAINQSNFESPLLSAGEQRTQSTEFRFSKGGAR